MWNSGTGEEKTLPKSRTNDLPQPVRDLCDLGPELCDKLLSGKARRWVRGLKLNRNGAAIAGQTAGSAGGSVGGICSFGRLSAAGF